MFINACPLQMLNTWQRWLIWGQFCQLLQGDWFCDVIKFGVRISSAVWKLVCSHIPCPHCLLRLRSYVHQSLHYILHYNACFTSGDLEFAKWAFWYVFLLSVDCRQDSYKMGSCGSVGCLQISHENPTFNLLVLEFSLYFGNLYAGWEGWPC